MAGAPPHFAPHAAFASAKDDPDRAVESEAVAEPEVAVFRLLLPSAFADADAIRLYAAIAPLRRRTPALQVRVESLVGASATGGGGGQVAVILGPASPTQRVEASSSSGEPLELSPAQEALVAVLESGGVLHGEEYEVPGPGCVTCLVLVEAPRLEACVGKGVLAAIAREAGAVVRVVPWEDDAALPCATPSEEVIEITGDRTTVRKALVAVSSRLQGDEAVGSITTSAHTERSMPSWTLSESSEPNLGTLHSEALTECANSSIPHLDCPQGATGAVQTENLQQFSFRLLCPVNLAGGLIGKKGMIVKSIEVETGASVDVSAPLSECVERVVTISALEKPGQQFSMVQTALLHVFDRMQKVESNMHLMFNRPSQCSARILVLKSQFGCLVGLGGATIKEMVNATRARIKILDERDVPACASQYELVLQITGEVMNVRDALSLVSEKLRNQVFSSQRNDYSDGYVPSSDIDELTASNQVNISSTGQYSTDYFSGVDHGPSLNAFHLGYPCSSQFQTLSIGSGVETNSSSNEMLKPANGDGTAINNSNTEMHNGNGDLIDNSNHGIMCLDENKLLREIKTATITRITYEAAVCGSILHLVYGNNGNNLSRLREISGAEITVYDPPPETSDSMIVIAGTPDQAQSALAMLIDLTQQGQ